MLARKRRYFHHSAADGCHSAAGGHHGAAGGGHGAAGVHHGHPGPVYMAVITVTAAPWVYCTVTTMLRVGTTVTTKLRVVARGVCNTHTLTDKRESLSKHFDVLNNKHFKIVIVDVLNSTVLLCGVLSIHIGVHMRAL